MEAALFAQYASCSFFAHMGMHLDQHGKQPALNNIILCQQALQVMYVLLPSGELRVGWNEGRMWILWCPFDGIFITYL